MEETAHITETSEKTNDKLLLFEMNLENDRFVFPTSISDALIDAESEIEELRAKCDETEKTIKDLTPTCDKLDYILSACSGALCGVIDIFLIGKPGESPLGDITDAWFKDRTVDFAKLCGYTGDKKSVSSAIEFLEKKFKVPYDQSVGGDIFRELINLTPKNHHFKSLGHNPTLLGLFFSILDQFTNTSDFVFDGKLISLNNSDGNYELEGHNILSKLFCGFANWFGHIISDVSGSSASKGRGMGIPSPIWAWTNDVIAIKRKLNIPVSEFNESVNELALKLFTEGYDSRFQTTQAIPVFINEMVVRLFYSLRRLFCYFSNTPKEERSFHLLWRSCEPFSNATVKRMLTVAHGTFCLIDLGDATVRGFATGGGYFNVVEFMMRINIIGIGRFAISLYGEGKHGLERMQSEDKLSFYRKEKNVNTFYIDGLKELAKLYDDSILLTFINDFESSSMYKEAFTKTVTLAKLRNVPEEYILKSKLDIDTYFRGGATK